jgi:hypothetical protein
MRLQGSRWLLIATVLGFFSISSSPKLQAMTLYVYDLDSLVYLSKDVVDVEITRSYEAHGHKLIDVKVTHSDKGGLIEGQTIAVAFSDYYRKPKKGKFNSQHLEVGDHLVLFLVRAEPSDFFLIPKDAVMYMPLPGGMKLIQESRVFGFSQWNNPGPYVASLPFDPGDAKGETIEQFRVKVRDSFRNTKEWAHLVEAKQDELDIPRLLKLLSNRTAQSFDGRDFFTERLCMRFAESNDPELLSQALSLAKAYHEVSILQRGFGTPRGRDYLLAKVTDSTEPMPARLRYCYALRNAGEVYHSRFTEISANSWKPDGEADEDNSHYLARIAKAARETRNHEELCIDLIRCLDGFGQGIEQNKPAPLMADLRAAFALLKEFYDTKPAEELQFAIETATAHDRDAYQKLQSPCGDFISILRPADPAKYTKPEKQSLLFEYSYVNLLSERDAEVQPSVVLVHSQTEKRYVLPAQLQMRGRSTGSGSGSVVLPKDLPGGRYRVFFQLHDGDKVISTGHYFAAGL